MSVRSDIEASLTDSQRAVLHELRHVGEVAPPRYLRRTGLALSTVRRALLALEDRGLVVRYFNPWGPQTPWWWQPALPVPNWYEPVEVKPGSVWDWGRTEDRLWVSAKRGVNEFGCPRVAVMSGEHNQVDTVLPAHYFATVLHERRRGPVTEWSAQFSCPLHGECSDEMVRTDKTCALCGSLLNRH